MIKKYTDLWNGSPNHLPMWVTGANPGDAITIPGVMFPTSDKEEAGMSQQINACLIVLNLRMSPESQLQTFFHEYGHTSYNAEHAGHVDEIGSEAAAIRFALKALSKEGYENLAYREAAADKEMASTEPYRSAVKRLANDPLWRRYSSARAKNGGDK